MPSGLAELREFLPSPALSLVSLCKQAVWTRGSWLSAIAASQLTNHRAKYIPGSQLKEEASDWLMRRDLLTMIGSPPGLSPARTKTKDVGKSL